MGFVKLVKNKAYYKRFQVKFARRRANKTDYYARKRLIWQDKNKYDTPKFRFVVRFTNRDCICQVIQAHLDHDSVLAAAYGHELSRYGLPCNFANFPAAYATGLLLARKVNAKLKLPYTGLGNNPVTGEYFNIGDDDGAFPDASGEIERRPFKCFLDVGLKRTTTGSRLFAAVKGACDGGINVPHNTKRFIGTPSEKGAETDFSVVKNYIFGGHIKAYMEQLNGDKDAYEKQFSRYKKAGVGADNIESLFKKVHDAIRADKAESLLQKNRDVTKLGYFKVRKTPKDPKKTYAHTKEYEAQPHFKKNTRYNKQPKISNAQRKNRIFQILKARADKVALAQAELAKRRELEEAAAATGGAGSQSDSDSESD